MNIYIYLNSQCKLNEHYRGPVMKSVDFTGRVYGTNFMLCVWVCVCVCVCVCEVISVMKTQLKTPHYIKKS